MEKDETKRKKIYINQINDVNEKNITEIKLTPSIYRIKNNDNYDLNVNDEEGDSKHLVKKILHNSDDKNTIINNDNKSIMVDKLRKSSSQNDLRDLSKDSKKNKKNKSINNRYQFFENEDISDKYDDEFSLNKPKEKPNFQNKNKNDNNEEMNQMSEIRKIMLRSSNQNIKASYLQDEEDNIQTENVIRKNENDDKLKDINFAKIYAPYKKNIEKSNCLVALFSIGIVLSIITGSICVYLQLYGNEDVYILLAIISLIIIGIYIFGIKIISKHKENVLIIISMRKDPEKIIQSKYRKLIHLFIYLLLLGANYYYVILLINTSFLNNIKLSIRGKGYDIKQWVEYFSNKNYNEILELFEKVNITFLVFGWQNWLLMVFILIYLITSIFNYRLIKSIIQALCIFSIQAGVFLIYLSIYCYKFKDASSFEDQKISWATPGTLCNGCIAVILGFFGFYVFFMENRKKIIIFEIICFAQIILLLVFSAGLFAIQDKFYNYKKATCNSLFKYISEDYILKNKIKGCSSKYLFNSETIENIECPKDRIMINWEVTESSNENTNEENNNNINNINLNKENKISFGCINQSCCLQVYFIIKNKFDFLLILSIHQITYFLVIFILGIYEYVKIGSNLEEEFTEKFNIIIMFVLTFFIIIIVLPFLLSLPNESNQSILNKIKNVEAQEDSSIIPRDLIQISKQNLWKYTNDTFNSIKKREENNLKYNIIIENNNEYKLSYYEYSIISFDSDIIVDNKKLGKININDYKNYSYINSTKKIIFKSTENIINSIFEYFDLIPYYPLKENILLNIEINGIFVRGENDGYQNIINNNYNKYINITKEKIESNYNGNTQNSVVNILNIKLDFSIMNKDEFFYITGKINNDNGKSLINIYNYYFSDDPIYSQRTNNTGHFIIGPIYRILNSKSIYYLNIEASKINVENENTSEEKYIINNDYCKFYDIIKINEYGFHSNKYYPLNNIYLPLSNTGSMTIKGVVKKYEKEQEAISDVNIKLFYGEQINKINEYIEDNQNSINSNYLESSCIQRTSSNKEGEYNLNINKNGQFMIVFMKDEYYLEKHIFIVKDISSSGTLDMGTMYLVGLFNSGKIVVRLEWDYKPPDLDLICRFQVKKNHYCYTFFGNKKCVETEYFQDSREPKDISSEIIEINEFSEYLYFFYVRKYFDISDGKTKNEKKKDGVEIGPYINYTDIDIKYNEYLNNTSARLLIYTNGLRVPAMKINIPGFENNIENQTVNQAKNKTEYNYWAGFCINGKEGISSLKIVNKIFKNEISKDICSSYYDKNKLITFND